MANDDIPDVRHLDQVKRRLTDIANRLSDVGKSQNEWTREIDRGVSKTRDLAHEFDALLADQSRMDKGTEAWEKVTKSLQNVEKQLKKTAKHYSTTHVLIRGGALTLGKAFEKLAKSATAAAFALTSLGIDKLVAGIRRVYEYQERWTRAMGQFNRQVGALSPGMAGASKMAQRWEGVMHGLTGQFGHGMQEAAEFIQSFARMGKQADQFGMASLRIARGFGLSAGEIGKLAKTMYNMGSTTEDLNDSFRDVVTGARAAGVPVNVLSRDVAEASDFMARLGKTNRRVFLEGAAYARKFGMSIKELQGLYEVTDTFDSTAQAAAKLNTVFGTTINALDLMLEQDPSKRFEMVRKQLIAQGTQMLPQQRKLLADTLHLTEDQVNAMLDSGQSLAEFQKKKAEEDRKAAKSQKLISEMMAKTAETMFSFSAAYDRVTRSIVKLINPFLRLIGLGTRGRGEFKTFGQVMGSLVDKLVEFIDTVAGDPTWARFMEDMAGDVKSLAKGIGEMMSPAKVRTGLKTLVPIARDFYGLLKSGFGVAVSLGEKLMPIMKFIADHFRLIAVVGGGMALARGVKGVYDTFKDAAAGLTRIRELAQRGVVPVTIVGGGPGSGGFSGINPDGSPAGGPGGSKLAGAMQWVGVAAVTAGAAYSLGTALDEAFGLSDKISDAIGRWLAKEEKDLNAAAERLAAKQAQNAERSAKGKEAFVMAGLEGAGVSHGLARFASERGRFSGGKDEAEATRKMVADRIRWEAYGVKNEEEFGKKFKKISEQEIMVREREVAQRVALLNMVAIEKELSEKVAELQRTNVGTSGDELRRMALTQLAGQGNAVAASVLQGIAPVLPAPSNASRTSPAAVNYAAPAKRGSDGRVTLVAGDVYLDSRKVGRHIVRQAVVE